MQIIKPKFITKDRKRKTNTPTKKQRNFSFFLFFRLSFITSAAIKLDLAENITKRKVSNHPSQENVEETKREAFQCKRGDASSKTCSVSWSNVEIKGKEDCLCHSK